MDPDDPEGSVMPKGIKEIPSKDEKTGTSFDAVKEVANNFKDLQSVFGNK